MFSRIVIRNILCSSLKHKKVGLKTKSWLLTNIHSHITPLILEQNAFIPRRFYSEKSSSDMTVDFEYVKKATSKEDILIVDVREAQEVQEHGKIPNSVNIPLGNVTNVLRTMPEKHFELIYDRPKPTVDSEIIFYCMIGKRSGAAQEDAVKLGYKNVKNYLGSWTDWKSKTK